MDLSVSLADGIDFEGKSYISIYDKLPEQGGELIFNASLDADEVYDMDIALPAHADEVVVAYTDENRETQFTSLAIVGQQASLELKSASSKKPDTSSDKGDGMDENYFDAPDYGDCSVTVYNGMGYFTSLTAVEEVSGGYKVTVVINHNGCTNKSGGCKELSHFSVDVASGSFSNVTYLEGDLKNYTIETGGLGNNDVGAGLDGKGFKFDGTSGLGNTDPGSFTFTYIVSELQAQNFLAKSGNSYDIASFTKEDFEGMLNCGAGDPDTDKDGIPDLIDEYPNDDDRAFTSSFPSEYGVACVAFEDLWPYKGDYDLNDLVVNLSAQIITNGVNKVKQIDLTFDVKAIGAYYKNSFAFQLDNVRPSEIESVSGMLTHGNYIHRASNGTEIGQSKAVIVVADDFEPVINRVPGTEFFETLKTQTGGTSTPVEISIVFAEPQAYSDVNIAEFNWFLIKDKNRGIEIHLVDRVPTDLANDSYFGTEDDRTVVDQGEYYKSDKNLPWGIFFMESYDWVIEYMDITKAHYHIVDWAESGGQVYTDWYLNLSGYRNSDYIYPVED